MLPNQAISAPPDLSPSGGSRKGTTAAVLSVFAMGLGQLYNRQIIKGLLMLTMFVSIGFYLIQNLGNAIWGLFTLGTQVQYMDKVGKLTQMIAGDHSIFLMVEGLITIFVFILMLTFYVANIKDAYRIGRLREEGGVPHTFSRTVKYVIEHKFPVVVLTLPLLFVFFFTVLPQVFAILIAFTDYSSPKHVPPGNLVNWIGFGAFKQMFTLKAWSHTFYGVFIWTISWAVFATGTTFFGGFGVALLVQQEGIRFRSLWRTIYMLPFAIPSFVSLLIMRNLFNAQFGPLNQYLKAIGITGPQWLSDPMWAKVTLILVNTWLGFPVSMLLIIGILTTIPRDMYEAAEADGASAMQKFRMITFPSVMYALAPILIGQFAGNINNFNVIYLMTNGRPANSSYQFAGDTDILITWLYNLSINNGKYNFASVIGIILFIIIASFSVYNFRRTKMIKDEEEYR